MPTIATTAADRPIITAEGGTYALILFCSRAELVQIGKLGPLELRRGFYVYVGSALGPGGLRARVAHHQKVSQRPHWHIDYLRPHMRLDRVWYSHHRVRREHQWARLIHALRGASVPAAGFGCSDCKCTTHLFFFAGQPSFHEFRQGAGGPRRLVKAPQRGPPALGSAGCPRALEKAADPKAEGPRYGILTLSLAIT